MSAFEKAVNAAPPIDSPYFDRDQHIWNAALDHAAKKVLGQRWRLVGGERVIDRDDAVAVIEKEQV